MTLSIVPASAWLTAVLFFQTGSVPIWVPLAIILIVVLMFWWGLTRNNIREEEEAGAEHAADDGDTGHDGAEEVDKSETVIVEAGTDEGDQPAPGSEEESAVNAQMEDMAQSDDLTRIEGIGPKIATVLTDAGIMTYTQLAGSDTGKLEQIVREEAGIKIADPASWPQQAALAANGDWDGLKAFQKSLVAGRHRE